MNFLLEPQYSLVTMMSVKRIYPVITLPGKYPGLRALLWHFNGYYDSPDISMYYLYPKGIVITRVHCISRLEE
jgi:hypothetical protein